MKELAYKEADCRPAYVTVGGVEYTGEMTDLRVADDHPFQFKYDLRSSDYDDGEAASIEKHVLVNFFGTFLTNTKILPDDKDYLLLDKDKTFGGYCWGYTD